MVKWSGSTSSPIGSIRQAGIKMRRLQATQSIPSADLHSDYSNLREPVSIMQMPAGSSVPYRDPNAPSPYRDPNAPRVRIPSPNPLTRRIEMTRISTKSA